MAGTLLFQESEAAVSRQAKNRRRRRRPGQKSRPKRGASSPSARASGRSLGPAVGCYRALLVDRISARGL